MRVATTIVGFLALAASTTAQAACPTVYPVEQLITDLGNAEKGVRDSDAALAGTGAQSLEKGLPCLGEILPTIVIPRTYRAVAGAYYLNGNMDKARLWFQTAIEADSQFEYGIDDLPAEHPLRIFYAESREGADVAPVPVEGMLLLDAGTHYLDGRRWTEAMATLERPHLYQYEGQGQVLTKLMFGNDFPPEVLVINEDATADVGGGKDKPEKDPKPAKEKPVKEPKPGKEKPEKTAKAPKAEVSDGFVQRTRPPEKTPLMIAGGALLGGSVATYVVSGNVRQKFNDAESNEDADKFAKGTNQLVIMSGALFALGAGTLTWGIIVDAGGTPLPGIHVRF
ncbi:MAG: hypothetical protein EP330_15400 [Deltaproteobacteria bacterium]|nr:MAG: hypothetical protein EP330_15400 [Deltaproteobacteria bacterium]